MKDSKYGKLIWAGIVLAVLFMVWPFKKDSTLPADVQKEIQKTDSLRNIIDSRKDTREQIDQRISEIQDLRDSIKKMRVLIKNYESKIKQYNEKADNVPALSTDDLVEFLTDRYKDSIPSE